MDAEDDGFAKAVVTVAELNDSVLLGLEVADGIAGALDGREGAVGFFLVGLGEFSGPGIGARWGNVKVGSGAEEDAAEKEGEEAKHEQRCINLTHFSRV